MTHSGLADILMLLGLSVLVVAGLRRLGLPPLLGYLFVGIAAGPHALGWLRDSGITHFLGEIGVVFLLFTIGLEFSIPQFLAMRRILLSLGGTQVLVGTACGGAIAWWLGIPWQAALIVGGLLAMSSTAIVVKQLTDQLELQALHGRLALGILLFQDLAAVPFLVLIPLLASQPESTFGPLLLASLEGFAAFAILLALGRWLLRPLFHEVAGARSAELFTLTVLLVSLAAAWLTSLLGLSLALGAFIAGMMLGETEYRHQIEADIRPFRDILLGLFFIVVGMQLDLSVLPALWPWVLLLVSGLVIGKGVLIMLLTWLAGYEASVALRTGLVLANGGEFGFALLALALSTGLLRPLDQQPVLAAIVLSMALAPLLIHYNSALARRLFARSHHLGGTSRQARDIAYAVRAMKNHVILCGFGRVGQNMAGFLRDEGFDYVALDLEPVRIKQAWEGGEPVFYGDASQAAILEAAGVTQARALLISFNDERSALKTLHYVRSRRPDLPVLVRARDDASLERLLDAGATEVVPETLEASLMLAIELLLLLQVPLRQVVKRIRTVHNDRYHLLRVFFRRAEAERQREAGREHERLASVYLPAGAYAVGVRLGELGLGGNGVLVTAVRRGEVRYDAPAPDLVLQAGDVVVLGGAPEQLAHAEEQLLMG